MQGLRPIWVSCSNASFPIPLLVWLPKPFSCLGCWWLIDGCCTTCLFLYVLLKSCALQQTSMAMDHGAFETVFSTIEYYLWPAKTLWQSEKSSSIILMKGSLLTFTKSTVNECWGRTQIIISILDLPGVMSKASQRQLRKPIPCDIYIIPSPRQMARWPSQSPSKMFDHWKFCLTSTGGICCMIVYYVLFHGV